MQVYALTLGVNAYKDPHIPPLQCSSHDAREFAHVLRDGLGYHAQCMEEQKTKEIEQRIIQVGKRLKPGDLFVFYFAGHSKSDGVDTYFLLTGAHLNELHEVSDTDNGVLRFRHLKQITSGPGWEGVQRLFVFDDCSGVYTSTEPGLTVINSCDPGYGAFKLPDLGHGLFTAALLEKLRDCKDGMRSLEVNSRFVHALGQSMYKRAELNGVPIDALSTPAVSGSGVMMPFLSADERRVAATADEEAQWQDCRAKDRLHDYEKFVLEHPNHPYAQAAQERIEELRAFRSALLADANPMASHNVHKEDVRTSKSLLGDNWMANEETAAWIKSKQAVPLEEAEEEKEDPDKLKNPILYSMVQFPALGYRRLFAGQSKLSRYVFSLAMFTLLFFAMTRFFSANNLAFARGICGARLSLWYFVVYFPFWLVFDWFLLKVTRGLYLKSRSNRTSQAPNSRFATTAVLACFVTGFLLFNLFFYYTQFGGGCTAADVQPAVRTAAIQD